MTKVLVATAEVGNDFSSVKSIWVKQDCPGVQVDTVRFDGTNYPSRQHSMLPRLKGKIFKMMMWYDAPGYDYYVWMDSTFHMLKSKAVSYALDSMGEADICLFNHPERSTISDEVSYVINRMGAGDPYMVERYYGERLTEQLNFYKSDPGFIDDRLFAAGCFAYSANLVKNRNDNLMKEWFVHNCMWSVQDQVSLPYLVYKYNIKYGLFDTGVYDNPYFKFDFGIHRNR